MFSSRRFTARLIPATALGWLMIQAWAPPRLVGITACIIIAALMVPSRPRSRPGIAIAGFLILLIFLLAWMFILTGSIQGAPAFAVFLGGILFMGLALPLIYALSFPDGDQS